MKRYGILLTVALAGLASPAAATHWNVDYTKSHLGFTVQWSGEPFSAEFRHWTSEIDFDPADLAHSRVSVTVDVASEASDESDFDSGLKGAQGFETSRFPVARFQSTGFTAKSANAFVAAGTLIIRGISRDISLPFTLAMSGRTAHMKGSAHVKRTDFGLGQGEWAAPDPVAYDVTVTIDLMASK